MVGGAGLTNVLAGAADLDEVIQRRGHSGLTVLTSGPTPPNPGELLASAQMRKVLEKLAQANDFVLVDTPPLLPVADGAGLAASVDGVILSVRYGSTRRDQAVRAGETLHRVGATVLGVILSLAPRKADPAAGYGYESYSVEGATIEPEAVERSTSSSK